MEGQDEVEDDKHLGCPLMSKTKENVEKISEIVQKDRCLSIQMMGEMVNMDKETVRQILHDQLNMRKVCAKLVLKGLTQGQKDNQENICSDIVERITEQPDVLENVITCDEMGIFQYDPQTKRQSVYWKTLTSLSMRKAIMSKSKMKAMKIVFFDIRGVIMIEWVPEGQTVNQKYYLEVLTKLRE
jgi:hypothetical protein